MRACWTLALVLACTPASPLPVEQAPPVDQPGSYSLDICQPQHLVAGDTVTYEVTGAQPGETVFLGASPRVTTSGPGIGTLGGMQLDLRAPILIGTAVADTAGVAAFPVTIPSAIGLRPYVQAAIRRGPGGADSVKSPTAQGEVVVDRADDAFACMQDPTSVCGGCDAYADALEMGDVTLLPGDEGMLLQEIISRIDVVTDGLTALHDRVYGTEPISYTPGQHSQFFTPRGLEAVMPLVVGNEGLLLAAASAVGDRRTAAYGTDIVAQLEQGQHAAYADAFDGVLGWLLRRAEADMDAPTTVRTIGLGSTSASRTATWLTDQHGSWSVSDCSDPTAWSTCLAGADLVVVGSSGAHDPGPFVDALSDAQGDGAALLYAHQHSWNSSTLTHPVLALMHLTMQGSGGPGNFFSNDAATWTSAMEMSATGSLGAVRRMLEHFLLDDFSVDLTACDGSCSDVPGYTAEFGGAARQLRDVTVATDRSGIGLFDTPGESVHKLLVLLGDLLRQDVVFPMDKNATAPSVFLRSYLADHLVMVHRPLQPAQPDMGNYSRSDFSHITPTSVTVQQTSKRPFRSAAVYALPGQTFTVSRTDASSVDVQVRVTSIRDGSTHALDGGGYTRPKFLRSSALTLAPGQTLSLTSPYGGPVHVLYDRNDEPVTLQFDGVGQHPVWQGPSDDASFVAGIAADDYDHVEFLTSHFEIHSTTEKMTETMAHPLAPSGTALEQVIQTYHHGLSLALAGYAGPGIATIDEVSDHAAAMGWPIVERDEVQHFNADQATCGSGCSGNPYDAYWAFEPVGHGDLHEVGHNHERGRFKFNGREGHAHTNFYSYYPKQQHALATGVAPSCQSLPFESLFDILQDAHSTPDPYATVHQTPLNGWSQGVGGFIQMLMAAEEAGVVSNGWHLIGRLHVHERFFRSALNDGWTTHRDGLGFPSFTSSDAGSLSNNDYLLLAMGAVTGLDYRDWFDLWGLEVSTAASNEIAGFGYASVGRVFYTLESTGACSPWDAREVEIDGSTLYIDLSQYPRTPVDLGLTWESMPYTSDGSSVYFVTLDGDVGPTQGVWWGASNDVTELQVPVVRASDGAPATLVVDAYQRRCSELITVNAGRVGGCDHALNLSVDPSKNAALIPGETYETRPELPLLMRAWRWHSPEDLMDTLVMDLTWTP